MISLKLIGIQAAAVIEALAQFTENESCADCYEDPEVESKHLGPAQEVLDLLQIHLVISEST